MDALGPDGMLVNVSRGSVVDEPALVAALVEGRLGSAGLDVFAEEPHVPEALLGQTIAALCAVVAKSRNCQLLHELLSRFCQMMVRASEPAEASRLRDQLLRSVLSAGLLCRHFDFEAPGASAVPVAVQPERRVTSAGSRWRATRPQR